MIYTLVGASYCSHSLDAVAVDGWIGFAFVKVVREEDVGSHGNLLSVIVVELYFFHNFTYFIVDGSLIIFPVYAARVNVLDGFWTFFLSLVAHGDDTADLVFPGYA